MKRPLQYIDIDQFQHDLLHWYRKHQRDLPWRKTDDPYKIWVSEIMLQQTKVDTVIPYFERFMEKYPTPYELANADEEDVLKTWEGLGYYSRARNLQHAVREVVSTYGGKVPNDAKQLGSLKGVGPYTKGAILSIAFHQAEPAVDGNVMRVFARILEDDTDIAKPATKKLFEEYVRQLISHDDPSAFNQAIMDLGATICTPKNPKCDECPVRQHCRAYANETVPYLPVKAKKKKQKVIHYHVLLIQNEHQQYMIEKRPEAGLLASMWQFPMMPKGKLDGEDMVDWVEQTYGIMVKPGERLTELKHTFTHLIWQLHVYTARTNADTIHHPNVKFAWIDELTQYPFPVSHQKIMKYI